jgi:uncharacterized protein YdhG (YjbR/CyaY superfamily)
MSGRLLTAAIVIIAASFSSPVSAQQPGPPPGGGDKNLGSDVMPGVKGRSNEMERVKRDIEKPEKKKSAEETFPQIKEDFEQIQSVNSNVLQATASGAALDYARISDAAAEIKKRATRLKSNLFGTENEKQSKEKEEKVQQDLKTLLPALDDAINSFVHSPMFQNTKVVNPEDSAKARHDLEIVIKLSTRVGKEAERLKKENGG